MPVCMPHLRGMQILRSSLLFLGALFVVGCATTSHGEAPATLGARAPTAPLEAVIDEPGPVTVETVIGAEWHVPLSGVLDLEHPAAKAAGLVDRDEPIHIAFHALHHPTRGTYLVDTGVERALFEAPDEAALRGLVRRFAGIDAMKRRTDTKSWLERSSRAIAGVFVTHLHLDHVTGMRDVPRDTPVFVGPGETSAKSLMNVLLAPVVDRALEGKPPLAVWRFSADPGGAFEGIVDVFGDATVWALHVPGHTAGSTAFVARTPSGPVLLTGDACHTAWGWEHGVPPGSYSSDKERAAESLARLRRFVARRPRIDVRLGHQALASAP